MVVKRRFEAKDKQHGYTYSIDVSVDNKIICINTFEDVWNKTRYPVDDDFSSFMDEVFEKMMSSEIETFKSLLIKIELSEPEYYKKGVLMLENKRISLLKEAEKYVL